MPAKPPARHGSGPGLPVELGQAGAFVLGKQGLAGRGLGGLDQAVQTTAGVYGTAPTCYLSFAARCPASTCGTWTAPCTEIGAWCACAACARAPTWWRLMLPVVMAATTGQTERIARRYAAGGGLDDDAFDELTAPSSGSWPATCRSPGPSCARPARAGRAAAGAARLGHRRHVRPGPPGQGRGARRVAQRHLCLRACLRALGRLARRPARAARPGGGKGRAGPAPTYAPSGRRRPPTWPGGPAGTPGRPLRRWPRSATRSSRSP